MTELEIKCWAVDQIVKLHAGSCFAAGGIISEAKQLLEFVSPPKQEPPVPEDTNQ